MSLRWSPPVELSPRETKLCTRLKTTGKLFVFLRTYRHELFDEALQAKLEAIHAGKPRGTLPVPAAQLTMALLLQAYTRCSDEEAVRRASMDRAWQMVLDCLQADEDEPPFSKSTLVEARTKLVEKGLVSAVLERTVELARERRGFDPKKLTSLRVAIDSAPLAGAGRVEDTLNLLGSALGMLVTTVAALLALPMEDLVQRAGLELLSAASIKGGMDLDWSSADAVPRALGQLRTETARLQRWIEANTEAWVQKDGAVTRANEQLFRIVLQDVELDEFGQPKLRRGVTRDRLISVGDPEMRHGRKSKSVRIDGYKRYLATDLDSDAVLEGCVLPANAPEALGADKMRPALERYGAVVEAAVDRAFLPSALVKDLAVSPAARIVARAYSPPVTGRYSKADFRIDLAAATVTCPKGETAAVVGPKAQFPTPLCQACPQRGRCQKPDVQRGRTISIHPQEDLLQKLRAAQGTVEGRAALRERVQVEHALAHLAQRQGPRARYRGVRKNDFDVRRHAAIDNLFLAARSVPLAA